ncbi:flagellar export protein FliJ [Phenylobacterium sp.]|uniref:flagellar export protein FliJ n=1 Tax=Phenylobacterium sp. TaxID=1871053 RepID=UPI00286B2452|nr:flagellar export protein FliJ [Phenylobacterium sp.]
MSWSQSLVKLATYEVETRQTRLAEIAGRLADARMRLALLHAEGEAEALRAREDAAAAWYLVGYGAGLRLRKAAVRAQIDAIEVEELGARDALSQAFEEQKKYEHVVEAARVVAAKEIRRRENAELDEVGMQAARRNTNVA